jgi:hypothetical protein
VIFEVLYEASKRGELLLIDGGFAHVHLRRDKQLTLCEIICTRKGAGSELLETMKKYPATSILAKCPADLEANAWYSKKGFVLESTEQTKTGRTINVWRLSL